MSEHDQRLLLWRNPEFHQTSGNMDIADYFKNDSAKPVGRHDPITRGNTESLLQQQKTTTLLESTDSGNRPKTPGRNPDRPGFDRKS